MGQIHSRCAEWRELGPRLQHLNAQLAFQSAHVQDSDFAQELLSGRVITPFIYILCGSLFIYLYFPFFTKTQFAHTVHNQTQKRCSRLRTGILRGATRYAASSLHTKLLHIGGGNIFILEASRWKQEQQNKRKKKTKTAMKKKKKKQKTNTETEGSISTPKTYC